MHRPDKDNILFSILACLWAAQAAVIVRQILGLCQVPLLFNSYLIPEAAGRMAGKWDLLIYFVFIAVALISGKILLMYGHKPFNYQVLVFEGAVTFLMLSAAFKTVIYDHSPQLAQRCLTGLIIISVAAKIFYPELKKFAAALYMRSKSIVWVSYADLWWVGLIVVMVYMPGLERVTALMYIGDWMHHFDFAVMSVGWASLWGQLPYADVISQYGVGLPIIFAKITRAFGEFDYVPALNVMMWFVILYFVATYFFVRFWLKSALLAGVAFLLVFRLQMFHYGVSPLVWITPSACPLRFGLDIVWMALLLQHARTGQTRWLALAGLYSGFAVYYMTSVGMCAVVAYYFYLVALFLLKRPQKWSFYLCGALPIFSAALFFWVTLKGQMFQKEYWQNLVDYMVVFSHTGAMPMWESLKYRHFWAFVMSMVLPLTYMATLLYIGTCLYLKKCPMERLFLAVLCVYGLANYQYYVVRAAITSYYVAPLAFVLVACFWFARFLKFLPLVWQKRAKAAAIVLSLYALVTNQNYLAYPNAMNFSRNPMTDNLVIQRYPDRTGFFNSQYKRLKEGNKIPLNNLGTQEEDTRTEDDFTSDQDLVGHFRQRFDFKQDAALIDKLTKFDERVALFSSFETRILIQAKRPPFFYHFPMLSSRPMTFRSFPSDAAHTPAYVHDALKALQQQPPAFIFMEKVFMQDGMPSAQRVADVIAYIKIHYKPYEQGQYLVAMKKVIQDE